MPYPFAPNSQTQRDIFAYIRRQYAGRKLAANAIQPAMYLAVAELLNNKSSIDFDLMKTKADRLPVEVLIPSNRIVFANLYAFGVVKVPLLNGKPQFGNAIYATYPHEDLFNATKDAGKNFSELDCVRMLWNAKMDIKTEEVTRVDGLLTTKFQVRTDEVAGRPDFGVKYVDLTNVLKYRGDKKNEVAVNFTTGTYDDIEGDGTTYKLYSFLQIEGYEVLNALNVPEAEV